MVGSGRVKEQKGADVVRLALERGVNYVDTSPDYSATGSEECVGRALAGIRDQVFVATKWCTPWGHLGAGTSVADYEGVIEQSLVRLGTDYVDLVHVHSCDEVDRLMDPNMFEAFDRLMAGTYCAPHCGACLSSCPEQLAIDDVLRHRMYFEDYGDQKEAMRLYAKLERNASVCASCSAPCTGACPIGVPIQERMIGAHELLRLG